MSPAPAKELFAEYIFLVEENDHGGVHQTGMVSNRFEKLKTTKKKFQSILTIKDCLHWRNFAGDFALSLPV